MNPTQNRSYSSLQSQESERPRLLHTDNIPLMDARSYILTECRRLQPGDSLYVAGPVPPSLLESTLTEWKDLVIRRVITRSGEADHLITRIQH